MSLTDLFRAPQGRIGEASFQDFSNYIYLKWILRRSQYIYRIL